MEKRREEGTSTRSLPASLADVNHRFPENEKIHFNEKKRAIKFSGVISVFTL